MKATSSSYDKLGQDLITAADKGLTMFGNLHNGFVLQFDNLLPDLTALENVIFPTAVRMGRETSAAHARGAAMQVIKVIEHINRKEGATFLISTNDEKIAGLSRRQFLVGDGVVTG